MPQIHTHWGLRYWWWWFHRPPTLVADSVLVGNSRRQQFQDLRLDSKLSCEEARQHPVTKICIGGILKMHFNIQLSILRSIKDQDRIKVMFQTPPTKNGFDISSNLHVGLIIIAFWVFQMWNCFPKCHLNITLLHLQSSYKLGYQASDSVGRLWLFSLIIPYLK